MNATQTDGTAIGTALAASASLLAQSEAKTKIVILLTDGRSNVGSIDPVTAANAAAQKYHFGLRRRADGWVIGRLRAWPRRL
jgi:Ca-activated chloride channel family protein